MLAPTLLFTILLAAKVSHQQIINTDFASAIDVNVCQEMNVRTIFSRVTWATRSCQCTGPYSFRALCRRTYPDPGQQYVGPYDRKCDPRQETASFCLPTEDSDNLFQDCACRKIPTKKGRKTPGKSNGIGCSGGLNLGLSHTSSVYSTIVFAKGTNANDVDGCYIQNSSNGVESAANYPCDLNNNGHVIEFEKGATYQACVEGDNDAPSSISFLWKVVSSVGHGSPSKRDELVQSIKYHKTMARGDIKGTILVEDEDGTELHRFEV